MISKETFDQIIENGPNALFIKGAGIIWRLYEIKHNKPVYKKYWIVDGIKYDYTENYEELKRFIEDPNNH